jgi:Ala-tRNA(Pro) deacylase
MPISPRLKSYLDRRSVAFDEVPHDPESHANRAARSADLDGDHVAKAVVVRAGDEYMLAVVPASRHVSLDELQRWLGRDVRLASEAEIEPLFSDCALGAVPPIGDAYDLETVLDDSLLDANDVYFEGGDHCTFVHVAAGDWRRLMKDAAHADFAYG